MTTRRELLQWMGVGGAGLLAATPTVRAQGAPDVARAETAAARTMHGYQPVQTLNG